MDEKSIERVLGIYENPNPLGPYSQKLVDIIYRKMIEMMKETK